MEELKRCPFCGKKADVIALRGYGRPDYYVSCQGRNCVEQKGFYASKANAIKAWNRRQKNDGEASR